MSAPRNVLAVLPGKANGRTPSTPLAVLPDYPATAFGYAVRRAFGEKRA